MNECFENQLQKIKQLITDKNEEIKDDYLCFEIRISHMARFDIGPAIKYTVYVGREHHYLDNYDDAIKFIEDFKVSEQ